MITLGRHGKTARCAGAWVFAIMALAALQPRGATAATVVVRGTNIIHASGSMQAVVSIPSTAKVSLASSNNPDVAFSVSDGGAAAIALVKDPNDWKTPVFTATTLADTAFCPTIVSPVMPCGGKYTFFWERHLAIEHPPIPHFPSPFDPTNLDFVEYITHVPGMDQLKQVIPPATYHLYVLSKGPVDVRLSFEGLTGSASFSATTPVSADIEVGSTLVDIPTGSGVNSISASGSLPSSTYGIEWSEVDYSFLSEQASDFDACGYQDRDATPACIGPSFSTPELSAADFPYPDGISLVQAFHMPAHGSSSLETRVITDALLPTFHGAMFFLPLTTQNPPAETFDSLDECSSVGYFPQGAVLGGPAKWGCAGLGTGSL